MINSSIESYMKNNHKIYLLNSWKIILGIIIYIIIGEILKEYIVFDKIEPWLESIFVNDENIAEFCSEAIQYFLLASLLIPISIFFVVKPVNKTNSILSSMANEYFDLAHQYHNNNLELEQEIRERKKIETELIQARNKAEEAKLAKSQFLAVMSHEIRTPMNGVLGTTQLLNQTNLTDEQKEYVKILLESGQHLMFIIDDILDFSKLEANKLKLKDEAYNPKKVIQEVINGMKALAQDKNLKLYSTIDNHIPSFVMGDSIRIKQILSNLVSNAIKFTNKGEVSVSIAIHYDKNNSKKILFIVKDTGIGIAKERIKNLFQDFSQIDSIIMPSIKGSGLGLSICQKLVHLMGGEIFVESQEGVGSNFSFIIPLIVAEEQKIKSNTIYKVEKFELDNKTNINILLVEDNKVNQLVIIKMLNKLGYTVDLANNGKEALIKLETKQYNIILMDLQMPIMDGLTATKQIQEKFTKENRPKVIALTANSIYKEKQACFDAGMDDYMTKPIDLSILKSVLVKYGQFPPNN